VIVITVALRILIMQILTIHQGSGGGGGESAYAVGIWRGYNVGV